MKLRQKGHSGGFLLTLHRRVAQPMHRRCAQPYFWRVCGRPLQSCQPARIWRAYPCPGACYLWKVWKPSMKLRQKGHSGGFLLTSQRRIAQSMHRRCSQPLTETSSSASRQMPQSSSSHSSGSNPARPISKRPAHDSADMCRFAVHRLAQSWVSTEQGWADSKTFTSPLHRKTTAHL